MVDREQIGNVGTWDGDGCRTGKVDIGTHSLFLSASGPARTSEEPAVVIIQGIASSIKEWPAVIERLNASTRTYCYERSGFGESDASPTAPTAEQIAHELHELLQAAAIEPPYAFVCHSYGGIIVREFAHRWRDTIRGVVFVDANTEETPDTYPNRFVEALSRGLDSLDACVGDRHRLSASEWADLLRFEGDPRSGRAGKAEAEHYHESGRTLASKGHFDLPDPLLGNVPIFILHANYSSDMARLYSAGLAAGNGSQAERDGMSAFIATCNDLEERIQRRMLKLSTNARFAHVAGSGHHIHMVQPDVVVEAVRWVLEENNSSSSTS